MTAHDEATAQPHTAQEVPSAIDELSESYFCELLRLSPTLTTSVGLAGADEGTLDDYSPAGTEAELALARTTLQSLEKLTPRDSADAVSAAALRERLSLQVEFAEQGESGGTIDVIASPIQLVRDSFDLMARDTAEQWVTIARRLEAVPGALTGYLVSLNKRLDSGPAVALRQVERCAEQCDTVADADRSSLQRLVTAGAAAHPELAERLNAAAATARAAYGELAETLRRDVAPRATELDAVGRDRYQLFSREFLGSTVDLDETYEWGLSQLESIVAQQEEIARELYGPGVSVREAMNRLDADPRYRIHGTDTLREWMQKTSDDAVAALNGTYFDIPAAMRQITCRVELDGTGIIYYTGPTEDFSRPGQMWWSVPSGVTDFSTWQEKTTVYHEGVPGHHLQLGLATYLRDKLNLWRRLGCWVSGHGEGWALYAEQLMDELGFHDNPADRMGMLDSQRLRAARVVVDLGVHLGKPAGQWGEGLGTMSLPGASCGRTSPWIRHFSLLNWIAT
ncbi:DUF885 domain-containing protein [Actinobaculum sp. 313]|uniref:DUF885 domain-containing protein n=1 Tax=Actinobaculum sp. 313 TaxID=2495645 RepID=UPI001F0BF83C|nr:DUF885 domain-containing protein [Actinobaculum sp. 313]